ncbi:SOS-response transcriptional repressor LexA [Methylobacterium fujisawaense]|uniref:SOS-response transcriptional repressor LexA n=1 Tax=Methylobacterium fujisawaense TaxID=107400 RepID=A0ABR6D6H1_9HYPH|nr:SOS-response transcriptional repressor LexA [Methylobacterium fujisawaense]
MPRRDGLSPVPIHPIDVLLVESPDAVRVPLIGQALCAGFPSPADDFLEGALELPRWLVPNPPATFLWRIRGSSMEGAGIHDRASRHCRTLRVRRRAGPDTVR